MCCTNNSTFSFKVAEISNPLLVATNLKFPTKDELNKENEMRYINSVEVKKKHYYSQLKFNLVPCSPIFYVNQKGIINDK